MINQFRIFLHVALIFAAAAALFWSQLRREDRKLVTARPIGLALALLCCCFVSPSLAAFDAVCALSLPLIARSRAEASALFVAAAMTLPTLTGGIAAGSFFVMAFSATDALAVGLLLAWAINPRVNAGRRGRSDVAFGALFLVAAIVESRGTTPTDALRHVVTTAFDLVIPYFCISRSIADERDMRRILLSFATIGFCFCVEGMYEARLSFPVFKQMVEHYHAALAVSQDYYRMVIRTRGGFMRAVGSFDEPTSFATFLGFVFVAIVSLRRSFRSRGGHYLLLAVAAAGLFLTQSRGGWITALAGLVGFDIYRRRYGVVAGKAVALAMAGVLLVLAAQSVPRLSQMLGLSGSAADTADYRKVLVRRGLEEARKAPLLGRDPKTVTAGMLDLVQGEGIVDFVNGWIYFLLMSGIVGVALLATSIALPAALIGRTRRLLAGRPALGDVGSFLFVSALMPGVLYFTTGFNPRGVLISATVLALASAFVAVARRTRPATAPARDGEPAAAPARRLEPVGA